MSAANAALKGSAPARRFAGFEICCINLSAAAPALSAIERATPRLSGADRDYAATFRDAELAAERLAAYIALRLLIERASGPQWRGRPFERAPHGKPRLAGAPIDFSVSHIPGLALIAVSSVAPVGVDVERTRPVRVRAERRMRIESAGAAFDPTQTLPQSGDARFLQAWVRLEAFAKARGSGIGDLLTQLEIVGAKGAGREPIAQRLAVVQAQGQPLGVRDLQLGEDLFAAAAGPPAVGVPAVYWLPDSAAAIEALLAQGT